MNEDRIRRADTSEIVLHWAQAVPFILLLFSGATMLLGKYIGLSPEAAVSWGTFHRGIAVCWVVLVVYTLLTHRPDLHFANIREVLFWRRYDLHWVVSSIGSLLRLDLELPPVGKFNAGQKMNFAGLIVLSPLFLVTGLVMWLHNTALLAWYGHVALFVLATIQVGGHLYMAFLHPATRVALGGIFHGWVPREYVEHHHPLMLGEQDSVLARWPLSRRLTIALAVALLAGVPAALGLGGYIAVRAGLHRHGLRAVNALIMPAELSDAHTGRGENLSHRCFACHDLAATMPAAKCLSCHEPIAERLRLGQGYHGAFTQPCESCHTEHVGSQGAIVSLDRRAFNHDLAMFRLEGRHDALGCEACHVKEEDGIRRLRFIGLPHERCQDCHEDPHRGRLKGRCERCHTVEDWRGRALHFDHDRDTDFRLDGKHAAAACADCHRPPEEGASLATARFAGLEVRCAACHEDVHRGQLGSDCERCHSVNGWRGRELHFDHNRDSSFPLEGRHVGVECWKCHRAGSGDERVDAARLKGLHSKCAGCHEDVHRAQLGTDCERCHSVYGWTGRELRFDHNRDARFRLEGKHLSTACDKCHEPEAGDRLATARFKDLATNCTACHDDPHADLYGQECTRCHTHRGWKGVEVHFDHGRDTRFPLLGGHLKPSCKQCHETLRRQASTGRRYVGRRGGDCGICHQDPHRQTLGSACGRCHSVDGWKGRQLLFSHERDSRFKIDPLHSGVSCAQCHRDQRYKPLETTCTGCHGLYAEAMAGRWAGKHGTADAHHSRVKCTDCHDVELRTQQEASYRANCARCHHDGYRGLYDDWQALVAERVRDIEQRIKRLAAEGLAAESVETYRRELASIRRIGAHNFRLARTLLAELAGRLDGRIGEPRD